VVRRDGRGLDLAKESGRCPAESKVVMLTAVDSVDDVLIALSLGARAWLPMTIDTGHLVRVIRGVHRGEARVAPDLLGRMLITIAVRTAAGPTTTARDPDTRRPGHTRA
jgi:DNA-binding NarL/FixJ family response regulator